MAQRANLIATYNSNPTLQSRYTLQQYLDLFGFGATTTPTPDPDPTPTPTPEVPGIPNIINQNLNQGGGGDSGPQGIASVPGTYQKEVIGVMPDGSPMFSGYKRTEGIGIIDSLKNTGDNLFELYQKFSPIGMIGRKIQQNKEFKQAQTNKALEQVAMQQKIREAEAAERARQNAVTYQYNNPSQRIDPTERGDRTSDAFRGGGANVPSATYTDRGREGFGYGLAYGGRVNLNGGGPTYSEEDFPFFLQDQGGKPKPSLDYYDKYRDSPDDEYPIITIPMGGKMKKFKKKKKKEKKFADGGRVYLYNRLK